MSLTFRKDESLPTLRNRGLVADHENAKKISFVENVEYELGNNTDEQLNSSLRFKRPASAQSITSSDLSFDTNRRQRGNEQPSHDYTSDPPLRLSSAGNRHARTTSHNYEKNGGWTRDDAGRELNAFSSYSRDPFRVNGHQKFSRENDQSQHRSDPDRSRDKESYYRELSEKLNGDLAAGKVAQAELEEELDRQQQKCAESRQQLEDIQSVYKSARLELARQNAYIESLSDRIKDAEESSLSKENAITQGDYALMNLRKELEIEKEKADKIESSYKMHLSMEDQAAKKAEHFESKYRQLCNDLCNIMSLTVPHESQIDNVITEKASFVFREYEALCQSMDQMTIHSKNNELEVKANRETIMRLVNEVSKEQKNATDYIEQLKAINGEREIANQQVKEMDYEIERLKAQLTQSQDAWLKLQKENADRNEKYSSMKREFNYLEQHQEQLDGKVNRFKEEVMKELAGDEYSRDMDHSEDSITNVLHGVMKENRKARKNEEQLQARALNLADELNKQRSAQKMTIQRANEVESQWGTMNERINSLEGELLASDLEREKLKDERKRYLLFLDQLAVTMKLDEIAMDSGFDVTAQALIARAEQLAKQQTESLQHRSSTIYNLQRKVKALKQQQESKDLHLSLTQRKIDQLEEAARDRQNENVSGEEATKEYKKLKRYCDKLHHELKHYKTLANDMKSNSDSAEELKLKTIEQRQLIDDLEAMINKLSRNKVKKAKQLVAVQTELEKTEGEVTRNEDQLGDSLRRLTGELQSTKDALTEARSRERQLVDFRDVVAKVIGLDVKSLSVPDFEIISRLERIVQAHHANAIVNSNKNFANAAKRAQDDRDYRTERNGYVSPGRPKSAHAQ